MRVPDEIRKTVVFVGVREDMPEWEWKGTGYLIGAADFTHVFSSILKIEGRNFLTVSSFPFILLATARHVAKKLEGRDFALRTNKLDGTIAIIEGHSDQKWWYHPTEEQYVDAAVTVFFLSQLGRTRYPLD